MRAKEGRIHFLKPGTMIFHTRSIVVGTVIGPGAVVTLHDRRLGMGGVCHFAYPVNRKDEEPSALFAKPAIIQLVRLMANAGSNREDIVATISGGAMHSAITSALQPIVKRNLNTAENLLNGLGINIIKRDIGGVQGRKLLFNTGSGAIISIKSKNLRFSDWLPGFDERVSSPIFPVVLN